MFEKKTKIVATLGPSSQEYQIIEKMVKAGVNVFRLNFSHGSYSSHELLIKNIRQAEKKLHVPIAVMQDLQGPKIRIGEMPETGIKLVNGGKTVIAVGEKNYKDGELPLIYPGLQKHFKKGNTILIDDGNIELTVEKVFGNKIKCKVIQGGAVFSHKGINLPDTDLKDIPALSKKDKEDLKFGIKLGVDAVALSFVKSADDIIQARKTILSFEKKMKIKNEQPIFIVSKIEQHEAIDNLDEIIAETDGVMVARGDLAMETNMSQLPLLQKKIIDKANEATKPVIVATQMLDSMQEKLRPTRAEITDVANAVIDHADALMLSNETAVGKHPVLVVETMAKIIEQTEKSKYDDFNLISYKESTSISKSISSLTPLLAKKINAKMILVASATGKTGRLVSRFRSEKMVLVGTETVRGCRQLCFSWGIVPFVLNKCKTVEDLTRGFVNYVRQHKLGNKGERVVMIGGEPVGLQGKVNFLVVKEI
ncbi:MAG TPA: pyruvate kinase [Candidatus Magasanikbacteria bacterium]|nr:pyruvate kinase [Candidatus Magasanikbacteria bacterium]